MEKRVWIKSGIVEELDARQMALIHLVQEKITFYYRHLFRTQPRYQYSFEPSAADEIVPSQRGYRDAGAAIPGQHDPGRFR